MRNILEDINYVADFFNIDKQVLLKIVKNIELKKYKKKEVFCCTKTNSDSFYFFVSGAARAYINDKNGREFTSAIFMAPEAVAPIKSLLKKNTTETIYECLTDCFVYKGNFDEVKKLASKNIEVLKVYTQLLEYSFIKKEDRLFELSTLSATDKYLLLKERIPSIENLLSQRQIASYLNITAVQLSRIRKKLNLI